MKYLFGIFLFLVLNFQLYFAQKLSVNQKKIIKSTIAVKFGEVSNIYYFDNRPDNFCTIGIDTFYNPGGYYFMFQLKADSAIRLDNSYYHGANFNRYLFTWQNEIYSLGGYGFFTTHNNLICFIRNKKEWIKVNTEGNGPEFIQGVTFINNDKLFNFNNYKGGNNVCNDIIDSNLYVLDLPTKKWQKYKLPSTNLLSISDRINTSNYSMYQKQNLTILINKKEIKFEIIENENLGLMRSETFFNEKADIIRLEQTNSSLLNLKTIHLNLDSIWNVYRNKSVNLFNPNSIVETLTKSSFNSLWYVLFLIFMVATGLFIYFRLKKAKAPSIDNSPIALVDSEIEQVKTIFLAIVKLNKATINSEELDKALDIVHLEVESRKLRRARYVNELNHQYPDLITRIKFTEDKRKFLYHIKLPTN